MKWTAAMNEPRKLSFEILRDENVGYYVYVREGDRIIYDYLQDTLEQAKGFSSRQFGVPLDAWKKVE